MNFFTINATSIPMIKNMSIQQATECDYAVKSDNCNNNCSNCSISQQLPTYGQAKVDRYTAVAVGATEGIVSVEVNSGKVVLKGTKGNFCANSDGKRLTVVKC